MLGSIGRHRSGFNRPRRLGIHRTARADDLSRLIELPPRLAA
jgi:hypothetical protein